MPQLRKAVQQARQTAVVGLTDAELLACFLERRDEAAFAALVGRHAAMVWGVCCRMLNYHEAEDAFQAAFLVFFRKAVTIRSRHQLASWLYGVAHQTALHARRTLSRRHARERQVPVMPEPAKDPNIGDELRAVLDAELSRLPDRYRVVVVLCDLEGHTRKEAARHLGCPEGTVAGRLARARTMLAKRLARHGLVVSGGALAAAMSQAASASASVPTSAVKAIAGKAISARVAALTEGVLKTMLMTKLKAMIVATLAVMTIGMGATLLSSAMAAAGNDGKQEAQVTGQHGPPTRAEPTGTTLTAAEQEQPEPDRLQGTWALVSAESDGQPVPPDAIRAVFGVLLVFSQKNQEVMTLKVSDDMLTFMGNTKAAYKLDAAKSPKVIETQHFVGAQKGKWTKNAYRLEGDGLILCLFNGTTAPSELETKPGDGRLLLLLKRQANGAGPPAMGKTAWGEPVGGLQAGLSVRPDRKIYHLGDTVTLIVRVRNVGKETVKFKYIRQFLDERPPTVTADGKKISQSGVDVFGFHIPVHVSLAPGKEIELESRFGGGAGAPGYRYELRPANGGGEPTTKEQTLFVGTGKVTVQYQQVIGDSSSGRMELDPQLSKLATGKLELQVQDAEKREDGTAWGKPAGGLQAGLMIRPEQLIYRYGDAITLSIRVRNVSKDSVKFEYLRQFLDENPPTVTDVENKVVPQRHLIVEGFHGPVKVTLAPGEEIQLQSRLQGSQLKYVLTPADGVPKANKVAPLVGNGANVGLQYKQVFGDSSSGQIEIDPVLSKLGTGKLELLQVQSTPWGKEVEGLLCRLRADKNGEFKLTVRDLGKRDLQMHAAQGGCEIEFDGTWFRWLGPVSILGGPWPAGRRYDDFEIPVSLGRRWQDSSGKPITLTPGKHTVRVAYVTLDRTPVRAVSNPVKIEIAASKKGER
jgi:RNA polymerase sigma factor (sigma-70 family)